MARRQEPWFVIDRSEALAKLLLTSREDVQIQSQHKHDAGVDLLVALNPRGRSSSRIFLAKVRGTLDGRPDYRGRSAESEADLASLPTCLLVVDVRTNQVDFAWLAEPLIQDHAAKIQARPDVELHPFDSDDLDRAIGRINDWYDVLLRQLQPT